MTSTYRDDLGAAHERIAELERERAETVAPAREGIRLAALDGDPLFAGLAVALAFLVRLVGLKVVASNRTAAERHLALLEAEIARLC